MEISASFRSLDALRQMSNMEFHICAGINKEKGRMFQWLKKLPDWKSSYVHDATRPLNFTTPV